MSSLNPSNDVPMEDGNDNAQDNDALIQELESSRRIRARLATSADASLPRVLSLLLPRLLRKMDSNRDDIIRNSGGGNSGGTQQLRTKIHQEYFGVINHAIDRIEILNNTNVLPIVQSMAAFVAEMADAPSSGDMSFITLGLTLALKILKLCLSRSSDQLCLRNEEEQSDNFDILISVLKASIVTTERMDGASSGNQMRDNNQSVFDVAEWLVLDSISLLMGMHPLGLDPPPSDGDGKSQNNEEEDTQRYTKTVATIAPLAGFATYNLFLDLILFQPNGATCGLSPRGIDRMQSLTSTRTSQDEIIDSAPIPLSRWNELKLAVLKVATGAVKGGGVLGWRGEMEMNVLANEDCNGTAQSIVLLVLAASGRGQSKDKHALKIANFANASLQAYITGEDRKVASAPIKKSAKGRRSQSPRSLPIEDDSAIVCAASMLLCLALGDEEACSAIRTHEEHWSNASVGTSSSAIITNNAANNSRSPLSAKKTQSVLSFVMEQLQNSKASIYPSYPLGEDKATLISLALHTTQLVLRLNEANDAMRRNKRMRIGWGDGTICAAQLVLVLGEWLNASIVKESPVSSDLEVETKCGFVEDTCKKIHENAFEILKSDVLPLLSRENAQGLGIGEEDQPEGAAPVAYRHRGRLARERRVARSRQDTLVPPLEIRKCCVDIMRIMARYSTERDRFLDVPELLFKCLAIDGELSSHIAVALEELLGIYEPFVASYRSEMEGAYLAEDRLVQFATPLLPLLLTASTSSSTSRRLAVKWCTGVMKVLDKHATRVLCTRLSTDSDKFISTQAKKLVRSIKAGEAAKEDASSGVMFFDSKNELDMEIVQTKLTNEIQALAQNLQISWDGAAVIMQSNHYSFDRALEAIKKSEDLEKTLESCGVRHRCRSLLCSDDSSYDDTCSVLKVEPCNICYDDMLSKDDVHSLPCKHAFCTDCFSTYLRVKVEGRELLNCPHHGCSEVVVEADVKELLPSMLKVWKEHHFRQFITQSSHYKFCPGSDCTMVAFSENIQSGDAHCTKCDTSFCFCCGGEPHIPATCHDLEEFLPLFNTSEYCVMKFSKRCPHCKIPIEKDQGCNHMTCRECNSHFCWLCLSPISGYEELERHACNKFDPRDTFNAKGRDEFFLARYEASAEGEVYAKKGLDSFLKQMADADCGADDDIRAMIKVFECLITSRNFLKNSFIIAWSWQKDEATDEASSTRKDIFEAHQATLTAFTENLQQLVEKKDGLIDLDTLNFYSCALKLYVERMMDFISRCKDDSLKTKMGDLSQA
mmetsp:Transcript_27164/g.54332  ORF Transcript_27164/g.54332 Transcript_27164/m.54332 type:complete len:1273 (+) Transcript_27164:75-3893(+)